METRQSRHGRTHPARRNRHRNYGTGHFENHYFTLLDSDKAIAKPCFLLLTFGPFFEPDFKVPALNSSSTFFYFRLLLVHAKSAFQNPSQNPD